jgi:selenium metabolism protein YedF
VTESKERIGTVVQVTSETLGRGDEELGAILMAKFLDTLASFEGRVSHALFLNGGARLAVEGSPVLEQLRQLEQLGVRVLVCGTCLDHFGARDRLAAGGASNMYEIVDLLSSAERILRP